MGRTTPVSIKVRETTKTLAQAAADERDVTLSSWCAETIRREALRQLGRDERPSQEAGAGGDGERG